MVSIQEIHSLIKSLNKAEKRFFKLLSATENYPADKLLSLFDTIDKTKCISELERRTKSEGKKRINVDSVNQLYKLILASQRNFYSDSNPGFSLIDEISNLKILFEKAQYRQCSKMLKSAKEKAAKIEKFNALLQLVEIEKLLLAQDMLDDSFPQLYALLDKEQQMYCDYEINYGSYIALYAKIRNQLKQGTQNDSEFFEKSLSSLLLSDQKQAITKRSRFLYHHCRLLCYVALRKPSLAKKEVLCLKNLIDQDSLYITEMPRQLIDFVLQSARLEIIEQPRSENTSLADLEKMHSSGKIIPVDLNLKLRSYIYLLQIQIHFNSQSRESAEALALEIIGFIRKEGAMINHEDASELLYCLTNYYIYNQNFKGAATSLSLLRNYTDRNTIADIKNYSVVQEYIVEYEIGHAAQLSLLKPQIEKLISNKIFNSDEENVIRKITNLPTEANIEKSIAAFIKQLDKKIYTDVFRENLSLKYFNGLNFLNCKIGYAKDNRKIIHEAVGKTVC
jgi:hypothetical protein